MSTKVLEMVTRDGHGRLMDRIGGAEAELREQGAGITSQRGQLAWTCALYRAGERVATCKRGVWSDPPTRRGTTNGNARGNTQDRLARRRWLARVYESDVGSCTCRCYRCGLLLTVDTVTVDRIIPGAKGGTYRRNNIRPACARCNSETGGAVRA